jgi:hypothetical protein
MDTRKSSCVVGGVDLRMQPAPAKPEMPLSYVLLALAAETWQCQGSLALPQQLDLLHHQVLQVLLYRPWCCFCR